MVSYFNPLAMYRHQQQNAQYSPGAPGWYQQSPQQYLPACTGEMEAHSVATYWPPTETHKYLASHHPALTSEWPQDCNHFQQPSPPISDVSSPGGEGFTPPGGMMPTQRPHPVRSPYEWMKKTSYQSQPNSGKTRTKDKYRVVYSDHQRLELEKEFHYSRYITIRRKAELANNLGLSERQIKIWFQNRRAKERKQVKRREESQHKIKQEIIVPISATVESGGVGIHSSIHHMQNSGTIPSLHGNMTLM